MRTQKLGQSDLVCTRLAYGCWRLLSTWEPKEITPQREAEGRAAVIAAYEAGYTLFDHADIYCSGHAERVFGEAMQQVRGMRDRILIATKCGIRFAGEPAADAPARYDFSRDHILSSCEQSLKRLRAERIDLYQLHRPDWLMNPEEVAGAFDQLKRQGKVREFGVSNFAPTQVALLAKYCPMRLIVNQVQIHLGDLRCFTDGTLDQCMMERMTPLAWSPLGGGFLGTGAAVDAKNAEAVARRRIVDAVERIAKKYGATRSVIALAWLLKHPSGIIPIVGSNKPRRIQEALAADALELSREDWYTLLEAARGERVP